MFSLMRSGSRITSYPKTLAFPEVGIKMAQSIRMVVDFPDPLGPRKPEDLTRFDLKGDMVHRHKTTKSFFKGFHFDHVIVHSSSSRFHVSGFKFQIPNTGFRVKPGMTIKGRLAAEGWSGVGIWLVTFHLTLVTPLSLGHGDEDVFEGWGDLLHFDPCNSGLPELLEDFVHLPFRLKPEVNAVAEEACTLYTGQTF